VQFGTVRYLGTFLTDPVEVPWLVVDYVVVQLDVTNPSVIKRYTEREKTAYEHAWEIRDAYGYRDFSDPVAQEQLRDFMDGRAWTHAEGALALFTQATAWLRRQRVLLPGLSTLARLVSQVRDQAAERMYDEKDEHGKRRYTVEQIAAEFGVTRPTIYRHLGKTVDATPAAS
jgi:Domain of unknown function (DUF4158)/Bacterial regulatory proteins, tetR family